MRTATRHLLIIGMLLISLQHQAQRLDVTVANAGANKIQFMATATAPGFSSASNSVWGEMNLTWRIPKTSATPPPTVAPPATTPEVTNESTAFTGAAPRDVFNGGLDLSVFDATVFGEPDDGYWYFQVVGTAVAGTQSIATGETVLLYEFTVPSAWSCIACVEVLQTEIPAFIAHNISTNSFIDNAGTGVDVLNLVTNFIPLPVDFLSFDAIKAGNKVDLKWKTANEENVKGYYAERSTDGSNWISLGFVEAVPPSGVNTYRFTDLSPIRGDNYYRIKEMDIDGRANYTATRMVRFGSDGIFEASIYPVPARTQLKVDIRSGKNEAASLRISDVQGRVIMIRSIQLRRDGNLETIEISHCKPGMYIVELVGASVKWTSKFIKE